MAWLYGDFVTTNHNGNVTINGTLTVTELIATTTVSTGDNCILLNDDVTGTPTEEAGIEVERGTELNAQLKWNETLDRWEHGTVGNLVPIGSSSTDELAKVSANDTTPGFLNGKLVAGLGVTFTEQNDGGNETLEISASFNESHYEVFEAGTTVLGAAYSIVDFDTEESANTDFSLAAGRVTCNFTGRIKIIYGVSADATNGTRANVQCAVHLNAVEVVRSRAYSYHRNITTRERTSTKTILLSVTSGDLVDVRALILGDGVTTLAGESNLVFERIS